ncbi:MAG: hypothetical protein EXS50_01480 [Candidatus Taylorbacteria bacterium]|nr:hypothetical protein [Candidatus Taylorbacteria bacterium]
MNNILCVCIGNSDRSPVMAAVLAMFLKNAGHDVNCESAGVSESAAKGGPAPSFAVFASKRIGLDISGHSRRRTTSLDLKSYDLIVCVSDEVAGQIIAQGADVSKIFNAQITNPWPVKFQDTYDATFGQILVVMYQVVKFYFPQS